MHVLIGLIILLFQCLMFAIGLLKIEVKKYLYVFTACLFGQSWRQVMGLVLGLVEYVLL